MKKYKISLIALIALLALSGCGEKKDSLEINENGIEIFHKESDTDVKIEW